MAKIIINHLGAISSFETEINQFNLFIGEQATGKSTICKAIYFFRCIKDELIKYLYNIAIEGQIKEELLPKAINQVCKNIFIELFGSSFKLSKDLQLQYICYDDIYIQANLTQKNKFITIKFSPKFNEKIKMLEKEVLTYHKNSKNYNTILNFGALENLRLHQDIIKKINTLFGDDMETYYIPAGRSLLTLMTNQKTTLSYDSIDLVNKKFMQLIESIQSKFDMGISNVHKYFPDSENKFDVHKISQEIIESLKGEYIIEKRQEYLTIPNSNEKIPINFISSGQQELLWLLNLLYILLLLNKKSFVIIEEPEAHLYPTLQKQVVDFIVQFMNITGSTVFVTTHSPYILSNVNTLYYAGRLISENKKANEVEKIMGKYNYIHPDCINACKLINKPNSTVCEKLIDKDSNEILTELIDEISNTINEKYTELFYLEEE